MNVIVYSRPNCQQCKATYRKLTDLGIAHTVVNLRDTDETPPFAVEAGYTTAPVVIAERTDGTAVHWQGFRPDLIALIPKE